MIGGIGLTAINCILTHHGSGKHVETLTLNDIIIAIKLGFVGRILYQFSLMSTKFAICAFYHRVFTDSTSKKVIWLMAALITLFSVPLLFILMFQCRPVEGTVGVATYLCSVPWTYKLRIMVYDPIEMYQQDGTPLYLRSSQHSGRCGFARLRTPQNRSVLYSFNRPNATLTEIQPISIFPKSKS